MFGYKENKTATPTIIFNNFYKMSEKEIEKMKNSYDLVTNAYSLKLLGKHNFKKCMLVEWKKKDHEIDKYIEILEVFEKNTIQALKNTFNFLSK